MTTPYFAQPATLNDPTAFHTPHPSDTQTYQEIGKGSIQVVPTTRGRGVLTLAEALGDQGKNREQDIQQAGRIVFHALGDSGNTKGPQKQDQVTEKLVADFDEADAADVPAFLFHLGDVIYSFGERKYYYDQFYEAYRNYNAPIFAIPGNHDGVKVPGAADLPLQPFIDNFCATAPVNMPEALGLVRTAQIQPGVYFTLKAPFVRIIGLYSNALEDPGVISDENGIFKNLDAKQVDFLTQQLSDAKKEGGAVVIAVHHPPITGSTSHIPSPNLLKDIDRACQNAKFWPHAVFSGHAHNHQRYTRIISTATTGAENDFEIPHIVSGVGGHGLVPMRPASTGAMRTPLDIGSGITLEYYFDKDYGYLRVVVDKSTLRIEFHEAGLTYSKVPSDVVTVDIATHKMMSN